MITEQTTIDPKIFRRTMSAFATGVTIITTAHGGEAHGMTANAFMSVSLEPPLVLVSIGTRARMHGLLTEGQRYGVSILSEGQQQLSNHFAGQRVAGLEPPFVWQHETPLLEGAVAQIVARVVEAHPAGDHTLFIGHVEYLAFNGGWPLLYNASRYEQIDRIGPHAPAAPLGWL
ncbi:MAG: flavin reductase family protein [Chloroflexaceae bacterium]|nr:flavin reductase family protein [Chloroflexaceae bacterium]